MREEAYSEPIREGSVGVEALASLPKNQLLSLRKSNSIYYILKAVRLLSRNVRVTNINNNKDNELISLDESDYQNISKIYGSNNYRRIIEYFLDYGASTGVVIQRTLNIDEATTYRIIGFLVDIGVILPSRKIKNIRNTKGGPKATIYQTPDADPEQIARAEEYNARICNPRYVGVVHHVQKIMNEWVAPKTDIKYIELCDYFRRAGIKDSSSMADLASREFIHLGIRVWR